MDATLDKVRGQSSNALPHIQRPALLLQAIDSTLAESSTAPSPTAYFASLLATLSQVTKVQGEKRDDQLISAALYLLGIVSPYTPSNVLATQHDALLSLLSTCLSISKTEQANLKSILGIQAHLLDVYPSKHLQRLDATALYNSLLPLLADSRPKLRKKAHDTIRVVFEKEQHPYLDRTAEWITLALEAGYKDAKRNPDDATRLIGLLVFVQSVVAHWPKEHLDDLLAQLMVLPKINHQYLARASFDVLESLFTRAAHNSALPVPSTFASLVALRPANTATHTLPSWLAALEHAFVALHLVDPAACTEAFSPAWKDVLDLCGSNHPPEVRSRAEKTAKAMIRWCLPVDNAHLISAIAGKGNLCLVVESLDQALSHLKYTGAGILHVLNITAQLVQSLRVKPDGEDQTAAELFLDAHLTKVAHFRANPQFEFRDAAEHAIAAFARVVGPAHVLRILPLNLFNEDQNSVGRAWLLPLLKGNITNTKLSHFTSTLLPLSETLFNKAADAGGVEKKIYEALIDQIWTLLPGYCDLPVDCQDAFTDAFAQVIGSVMYSQPSLRPGVFRALTVLIESNEKLAASTAPPESNQKAFGMDQQQAKNNLTYLGKKGVNLLSGMFNVYLKSPEGSGYMLETVSAWMRALTSKDLAAVHGKIVGMLNTSLASEAKAKNKQNNSNNNGSGGQTSHALLDLLVCLSGSSNDATAVSLLQLAQSGKLIENEDSTVQKKAYRLLLRVVESPVGRGILNGKVDTLILELADKSVAGPAKKDRTELLCKLIDMLPTNHLHVVPPILSEAVLATKETNERTRQAGFDLIIEMGNKMRAGGTINRALIPGMQDGMDNETPANVSEYFTMVAAGLTSTPHMISACITALSRLLFDFHKDIDVTTTDELLSTISVFLKSNTREIVKSSLGFVKVCIAVLPHTTVETFLPNLVPSLLGWGNDHKNHFNLKVRHIFERLIRKFGFDKVASLVPEDGKKLVQNIRKKQLRAKRKKTDQLEDNADDPEQTDMAKPKTTAKNAYEEAVYGSEDEAGDDSDDDPMAPSQSKQRGGGKAGRGKSAHKTAAAYLQEDGDMPMDLLDQEQLDRVTINKPSRADKQRKAAQFEKDASGRMIVNEEEGGHEDGAESTNAYLEAVAGEDGFHRTAKGAVKANKGRKRSRQEEDDDRWVDEIEGKMRLDDSGSSQRSKKKKSFDGKKQQIGSEFKAKKGGGDVKKGDISPYAYVPLGQVAGKGKNKSNIHIKGQKGRDRCDA